MATNIDKALYQQPMGIDALGEQESPLEIEIVDPEEVTIGMDGMEITLTPGEDDEEEGFDDNLAEYIDDGALQSLAGDLSSDIDQDKQSRKEWEKTYVDGLKLLGLQIEERTEPWNGACGVFHPMITEAVVRFQAETITETFPAQGPVRSKLIGKETPEMKEVASNVEDDMNYELTEVMTEYRAEHERMLWSLPATGSAFKKVYYDPNLGRQVSMFIPAEDMYLHIDRDKYIAGEDIWFSIYNVDQETGKLSAVSVIAYAELLNPWNVPIIQKRLQLSGGRGEGNFTVPDSVSSGRYTLRAYTNIMKNFLPDKCFMQDIDVYNPFRGSEFYRKTNPVNSFDNAGDFPEKNEGGIILNSDTVLSRREKVYLDLTVKNYDSELSGISEMSISVAPAGIYAMRQPIGNKKIKEIKAPLKYPSESEGHYLSGLIRYREGNSSDSSDFLYMSVQGKVAEFRYSDIDTEGHFSFLLPVDAKFRNLILQPEHASSNMILEIEPSFPRIFQASICLKELMTDSLLDLFSGLSFNYQAGKIYSINLKNEKAKKSFLDVI